MGGGGGRRATCRCRGSSWVPAAVVVVRRGSHASLATLCVETHSNRRDAKPQQHAATRLKQQRQKQQTLWKQHQQTQAAGVTHISSSNPQHQQRQTSTKQQTSKPGHAYWRYFAMRTPTQHKRGEREGRASRRALHTQTKIHTHADTHTLTQIHTRTHTHSALRDAVCQWVHLPYLPSLITSTPSEENDAIQMAPVSARSQRVQPDTTVKNQARKRPNRPVK